LDVHRKQITFDYVDTETGRLERGQVRPADRAHLAVWLRKRFAAGERVEFAVEACTGWRYVVEELQQAGCVAHLADPAETAAARGRKKRAKTDRADARLERELLADGRLPECWVPPAYILECRALLETYHELREQHTGWLQRIHAVLFHQGAPSLAGSLDTEAGRARLGEIAASQLSPVGQVQIAVALEMMAAIDVHLEALRTPCRYPPRARRAGAHRPVVRGGADDTPCVNLRQQPVRFVRFWPAGRRCRAGRGRMALGRSSSAR
jgi:hypothetical protein